MLGWGEVGNGGMDVIRGSEEERVEWDCGGVVAWAAVVDERRGRVDAVRMLVVDDRGRRVELRVEVDFVELRLHAEIDGRVVELRLREVVLVATRLELVVARELVDNVETEFREAVVIIRGGLEVLAEDVDADIDAVDS